jgi:hypothetical protein
MQIGWRYAGRIKCIIPREENIDVKFLDTLADYP